MYATRKRSRRNSNEEEEISDSAAPAKHPYLMSMVGPPASPLTAENDQGESFSCVRSLSVYSYFAAFAFPGLEGGDTVGRLRRSSCRWRVVSPLPVPSSPRLRASPRPSPVRRGFRYRASVAGGKEQGEGPRYWPALLAGGSTWKGVS